MSEERRFGELDERGFSSTNQGVNTDLICRRLYDINIYVIIVIFIVSNIYT